MAWKLISNDTGAEIKVGDSATTFRGDACVVKGLRPPHKPSSSGHVSVEVAGQRGYVPEYYPSVIGCHYVEA